MTLPEVVLWQCLRQRPEGLKFRRQHPTGPYVLDFFCSDARLAIEVDGEAIRAEIGLRRMRFGMNGCDQRESKRCAFLLSIFSTTPMLCCGGSSQKGESACPSTTLRAVPLPETSSGRIDRRVCISPATR
jgi:hypothetical protein